MRLRFPIFLSAFLFILNPTSAQESSLFRMFIDGDNRCFESNGIPDHKVGEFPTRGNPHSISSQEIEVCVPRKPVKNKDLWEQLDALNSFHNVSWKWVKAHAGHRENEIADMLANKGIDEL